MFRFVVHNCDPTPFGASWISYCVGSSSGLSGSNHLIQCWLGPLSATDHFAWDKTAKRSNWLVKKANAWRRTVVQAMQGMVIHRV